jgi:hypothetical protein
MFDSAIIDAAMRPAPATDQELQDAAALAPGDYEIYSENLVLMLQEGKEVMTKMGISSMLHSGDTLVAIYTAGGDLVSAVLGTYLHSSPARSRSSSSPTSSPTTPRSACARATSTTATRRSTAASTTRTSSRSCPSSTTTS